MRKYAHELMNNDKDLKQINILSLRRNEKDFIIRKELQYVVKFNELINELKFDILDNTKISKELNWHPKTSFNEGLKQTVEFYKNRKRF